MTKKPLISIVMPIYNSAEYLYDSVASIINQSYKEFELLIVDDSPTDDGSLGIINSFNDNRIKYFKPISRLGLVRSINYAIERSSGEYIARMDSDDISHSDRFNIQINYMINHPEVGVVGCNCYTIDEKNKITGNIIHPIEDNDIKIGMLINSRFIHPSVVMRREILENERYSEQCFCCEDYELWSRLMYITKFHNIPENLLKYRIISGSAMRSQVAKLKINDEYYKRLLYVIKLAYDNVFNYFDINSNQLPENYEEYMFAKRLENYSLKERKEFIFGYKKVLNEHITNKIMVNRNCAYLWLKLSKNNFWRIYSFDLICECIKETFLYTVPKVISVLEGIMGNNKKVYQWNIKK